MRVSVDRPGLRRQDRVVLSRLVSGPHPPPDGLGLVESYGTRLLAKVGTVNVTAQRVLDGCRKPVRVGERVVGPYHTPLLVSGDLLPLPSLPCPTFSLEIPRVSPTPSTSAGTWVLLSFLQPNPVVTTSPSDRNRDYWKIPGVRRKPYHVSTGTDYLGRSWCPYTLSTVSPVVRLPTGVVDECVAIATEGRGPHPVLSYSEPLF